MELLNGVIVGTAYSLGCYLLFGFAFYCHSRLFPKPIKEKRPVVSDRVQKLIEASQAQLEKSRAINKEFRELVQKVAIEVKPEVKPEPPIDLPKAKTRKARKKAA